MALRAGHDPICLILLLRNVIGYREIALRSRRLTKVFLVLGPSCPLWTLREVRWVKFLPGRLGERDLSDDGDHEQTADDSKRRHEVKIAAPTFIEQQSEKISGETAAEILEGIDQPGLRSRPSKSVSET